MSKKSPFERAAELAVLNVIKHGDTDIFPFPFDNNSFFDKRAEIVNLLKNYDDNFETNISAYPPQHISSLVPAGYSGFRWATQLDPIWNLHFLASVLTIANEIELQRIPATDEVVFSYRFSPNTQEGSLFDKGIGWYEFMRRSLKLAGEHTHVVVCDISEFYPRLSHHRLENSLSHAAGDSHYLGRIMAFLSRFANTNSFGLPIGGPASRILSESAINQVDWLLLGEQISFLRFADDYHLFTKSKEDAYRALIFLSEKLYSNQGLTLQKSKTRILTAAEFRSTAPISTDITEDTAEAEGQQAAEAHEQSKFLRFSLRFDPYSPTADDDYDRLSSEVRKFDILGLLKKELAKSRIHVALSKKIVSALRYIEGTARDDAVLSLFDNSDVLFPIFSTILFTVNQIFADLSEPTRAEVAAKIRHLIRTDSHVFRVDIHLAFAIRVLSNERSTENALLLTKVYADRQSPLIRRDIILAMAKWKDWYWLSDLKSKFGTLSASERRAFIIASYALKDEGKHWRDHTKQEFNPYERFILEWVGSKAGLKNWEIPL